eukprot:CAMPEP_0119304106 /NCGR_PEP_ID=MMETSP1333-20130426/5412_1 /TAXON_ID=418940 /ORGANISM="Scyphosphaera apsteinii, Strain RCC1455" /LENGTH=211 /DNA_ID=CAMNT_0007306927 /DNA_START=143 /DNA_END=778 /DNA_ORIENTATION=+
MKPVKIAAVGDSITQGGWCNVTRPWPALLQEKLGPSFDVQNFGQNGKTVQKGTGISYWDSEILEKALTYAADVVFVMLGTNDARPWLWNSTRFERDLTSLFYLFRERNERNGASTTVIAVIPPPLWTEVAYGISAKIVNSELPRRIRAVGTHMSVPVVSSRESFKALDVSIVDVSCDGCHPSDFGQMLIAKSLMNFLRHARKGDKGHAMAS